MASGELRIARLRALHGHVAWPFRPRRNDPTRRCRAHLPAHQRQPDRGRLGRARQDPRDLGRGLPPSGGRGAREPAAQARACPLPDGDRPARRSDRALARIGRARRRRRRFRNLRHVQVVLSGRRERAAARDPRRGRARAAPCRRARPCLRDADARRAARPRRHRQARPATSNPLCRARLRQSVEGRTCRSSSAGCW